MVAAAAMSGVTTCLRFPGQCSPFVHQLVEHAVECSLSDNEALYDVLPDDETHYSNMGLDLLVSGKLLILAWGKLSFHQLVETCFRTLEITTPTLGDRIIW